MFVIIILRTPTTFLFQQLQLVTRIKTWQTSEHQKLSENFHLKISSPFYRLDLNTQYQRQFFPFCAVCSFKAIKEQHWSKGKIWVKIDNRKLFYCGKHGINWRRQISTILSLCQLSDISWQLYKVYTQIQFALYSVGQLLVSCVSTSSKEARRYKRLSHGRFKLP